jgi:hypothetical protein
MAFRQFARRLHHFQPHDADAPPFESCDNLAHQPALHTIGLHKDQGSRHLCHADKKDTLFG